MSLFRKVICYLLFAICVFILAFLAFPKTTLADSCREASNLWCGSQWMQVCDPPGCDPYAIPPVPCDCHMECDAGQGGEQKGDCTQWANQPACAQACPVCVLIGSCCWQSCGDGSCDCGETCSSCATDCGACPPPSGCPNGVCEPGETCCSCPGDCGSCCGNGACDCGETCGSCPDCSPCCGDGICNEACGSCSLDCSPCCGDGTCSPGETCSSCSSDCGVCCSGGSNPSIACGSVTNPKNPSFTWSVNGWGDCPDCGLTKGTSVQYDDNPSFTSPSGGTDTNCNNCSPPCSCSYSFADNLAPGTYYWRVWADNRCRDATASCGSFVVASVTPTATVTPTSCPMPAMPTNLRRVCSCAPASGGNCTCTVMWDNVAGATGYGIRVDSFTSSWRCDTAPEPSCCNAPNQGDVCATTLNTSYTYAAYGGSATTWWVHAINACGWSSAAWSSFAVPYVPEAPTNLSCSPICNQGVSLRWSDNSTNEEYFRLSKDGLLVASIAPNRINYIYNWCADHNNHSYNIGAGNAECGVNFSGLPVSCACPTCSPTIAPTLGPTVTPLPNCGDLCTEFLPGDCGFGFGLECGPPDPAPNTHCWNPVCPGDTTCSCSIAPTPTNTSTPTPTTTPSGSGWFQTKGGDVYVKGQINDPIPDAKPKYSFCEDGITNFPGVVYNAQSAGIPPNFGSGEISSTDWLAYDTYADRNYNYGTLSSQVSSFKTLGNSPSQAELDALVSGYYKVEGDLTLPMGKWIVTSDKKIVIFVTGNLALNEKVRTNPGGFTAFIVAGNIAIDGSVGNDPDLIAIEAIIVANGTISTGSTDLPLTFNGSVTAWGGFDLQRQERGPLDALAEKFVYRPDFLMNSPLDIWTSDFSWEELAP